jgi:uncharacterized membrane protein YukC
MIDSSSNELQCLLTVSKTRFSILCYFSLGLSEMLRPLVRIIEYLLVVESLDLLPELLVLLDYS